MPGETPDYHRLNANVIAYPVTDLGEVPARLGALPSIDRRGDVVFIDSFESGLAGWFTAVSGAGATAGLSAAGAASGRYSALLEGGSDLGGYAQIYRRRPLPPDVPVGLECALQIVEEVSAFTIALDRYDGATVTSWAVRYVQGTGAIEYLAAGPAWTVLAEDVDLFGPGGVWNGLKLVIDPAFNKYVRVIVNDDEYDLSTADAVTGTNALAEHLSIGIVVFGGSGGSDAVRVDDVIMTYNEPV